MSARTPYPGDYIPDMGSEQPQTRSSGNAGDTGDFNSLPLDSREQDSRERQPDVKNGFDDVNENNSENDNRNNIQEDRNGGTIYSQDQVNDSQLNTDNMNGPATGKEVLPTTSNPLPDIHEQNFGITNQRKNAEQFSPPAKRKSDDGGWTRSKNTAPSATSRSVYSDTQSTGRMSKSKRTILQHTPGRKKKFEHSPPVATQPYSNSLVLPNGRITAARQQSTLFKEVKPSKSSPKPTDTQYTQKLPSLTGRNNQGSPIQQAPANKNFIHTTIYTENLSRRSKAVVKRPKQKLSKSEAHYVRLAKMVARVGSDLLRLTFYNYMERQNPPKKLAQFLGANKRRLKNMASSYRLISRRWGVMYPDEDESKANLQKLDSALIFWFMRFICHLKRPNDFIWKRKPAKDDLTETGDISRIRDYRNFLINLTLPALYDDEYDRKVEEFKKLTIRLCGEKHGEEFVSIIDEMKTNTVRFSEREQYLGILNQWADETGDRNIAPANYGGETVKDRKEMSRRFLERHRNPHVFVKTKIYEKARERLTTSGSVILKGNTGDGKTTLAIALMVTQYDEDECVLITSPDQWQYIQPRAVSVVLMDDIFGSGSLDEALLAEWETKFEMIYEATQTTKERPGTRVIITIRQHILEQCMSRLAGSPLFSKDSIIDCSSSELTFAEKRAMLGRHLVADNKTLGKSEIDKSAKVHSSRLGYPQCCALYVRKEAFLIIGSQFFERPIECLFEQLDRMYDGDKYGYLAMVTMMFMKDGILYAHKLRDFTDPEFKEKFLDLALLCDVPNSDHVHLFTLSALESQTGYFLNYYADKDCFTFSHESVMEALMASFGERHPQQVLEGCSLSFLMDFVGTYNNFEDRGDEIFIMRVRKQNFGVLAKVFVHYILHGEVKKISQHRATKDLSFLGFLFDFIRLKDNITDIILSEDNNFKEKDSRRKVGFLYGAVDQEIPNVELVTELLKTGVYTDGTRKEKWCLAEVESSICIAIKRGSYDIYKLLISTGVQLPDRVLYEEQFMTSTDIVRDMLTRRHWSAEQKDIAVVRAARGLKPESEGIVTLLLQDGAAVNSIRVGTTALCEAVKSGKMKTVHLLLASGASVNDRDATQQTPLHHACDWNNIEVVKILLKKYADVNARDYLGFTPLLVAAGWGRETILELLMAKRVDPLAMDDQENNVLHICAANGKTKIMKLFMEKYPREMTSILIARNRHGWTSLDFALRCGHLGVTKLLIHAILKIKAPKSTPRTFVHTRFYVVKFEDFDKTEKYQYRFLDETLNRTCFQMPRGNWFIQAGHREEYEEVRQFSLKYESKLRQCLAKS